MDNTFQDINGFGASPDGLGATVRLGSFGDDIAPIAPAQVPQQNGAVRALYVAYALAGVAGTAIGAYHGYKRNESVGWAIGWALFGGLAPVIALPIAFAQGIGDRKRR